MLVMIVSYWNGDNSTTMPECSFSSWLSKSFIDIGVDCYLSFLGENVNAASCGEDDVLAHYTGNFSDCFWENITSGDKILQAKIEADVCSHNCGDGDDSCTNPILVENYPGACNKTL
jgi:hypothetical protein